MSQHSFDTELAKRAGVEAAVVFRHVQHMKKTDTVELSRHFKYISRYGMTRAVDSLCALKLVRRYPEVVDDTNWRTVVELYEPE
jgi:hypothetical protein